MDRKSEVDILFKEATRGIEFREDKTSDVALYWFKKGYDAMVAQKEEAISLLQNAQSTYTNYSEEDVVWSERLEAVLKKVDQS